jgi:hemerythrin-like domain-containing protein
VKRSESLTPLSHDHHQALYQAMRLRRASQGDFAEVRSGALEFWSTHGALHFRIEEELLLPAFARHADPDQEAVSRVLVDHVWIRERFAALTEERLGLEDAKRLGERLESHVRHEERVLFPLIEGALPAEELSELGREIAAAEAASDA